MKSATGCGIKRRKNYVHIFGLRARPRPIPGGGLRAHHALLLHDLPGDEDDFPVKEEEVSQMIPSCEPELLLQALLYLRGDR